MDTHPQAPTGLDLDHDILPEAARSQASLPAFGALCSRMARRLGLDPMALASAGQKPWLEAAKKTLGAMAAAGAPLGNYHFVARDERGPMALMDAAFASLSGDALDPFDFPKTLLINMERRRTHADGSRTRSFLAASLHDKDWAPAFEVLASFFKDPAHARAHGIGHEFGHAWQSAMGHPMQRAASEGQPGPLAEALRARSERLSLWIPQSPEPGQSAAGSRLADIIEESVCDAIGCWAAQKTHGANVLRPVQLFRVATFAENGSRYATGWLLSRLEQLYPFSLPERFDQMVDAIESCVKEAAPILTANGAPARSPASPRP